MKDSESNDIYDEYGDSKLTPREVEELKIIAQSHFVFRKVLIPVIIGTISAGAGLWAIYDHIKSYQATH